MLARSIGLAAFSILAACGEDLGETMTDIGDEAPQTELAIAAQPEAATAGDTIQIVGSSTLYPFTTAVAEQFGAKTGYSTPIVESTGTGGGLKLFCDGVGASTPDFTNASRPIKDSELELCRANGVTQVIEVPVGYDGIVMANVKTGPELALTSRQLFDALAARLPVSDQDCSLRDNPNTRWSQIDPDFPDTRIEVYGPPPTSGTRDAFIELGMEHGAEGYACLADMASADKGAFQAIAHRLREDGHWIDAGENDNAIVQTLIKTPTAYGVFGYSFLDQNSDRLRAAPINEILPTFDAIASGQYPVSRTLFVYVKGQHVDITPGMRDFITEYLSEDATGEFGYLAEKGMIPLEADQLADIRARLSDLQ